MNRSRDLSWRLACAAAVALAVVTFTPLVIPAGRAEPMLAGVPYTMWTGMLVMVGYVVLTFIGARVHPRGGADEERR